MFLLIEHATIVTMDSSGSIFHDASLLIEDDRIIGINSPVDQIKIDKIIDAAGLIVLPGMINSHTHSAMTLLRNYADDLNLQDWLEEHIWPIEAKMTKEDIYWGSKLAALEMVASGTTCFMDMYFHNELIKQASEEVGIRAVLTPGLLEGIHDHLEETTKFIQNTNTEDLVTFAYGPHAIYTSSSEYLKQVAKTAQEQNAMIHIHLSESLFENESCQKIHGMSPTKLLESVGFFKQKVALAHCVHVSEEDLEVFAQYDVSVLHNPSSNLKLGNGFAPVKEMLDRGINVSLGTDGASSNNNLNMFEEMHLTSLIHKGNLQDPLALKAKTVLEMATINGAIALGLEEEIGSIESGKKADIIFVDTMKLHNQPVHDLYSLLVYSAQATDVKHVIVNGKLIYEDYSFVHDERQKVFVEVKKSMERLTR